MKSVEQDLNSADRFKRLSAIEAMRKHKELVGEEKIKAAKRAERDPQVRHRLNQVLVKNDAPGVVQELVDSLKNDSDVQVRRGAAQELSRYAEDPTATEALAAALQFEPHPAVRSACIRSLALSDTPAAVAALKIASQDPDPKMRKQAAFSLKWHTSREARKILKRLKKDGDPDVRRVAKAER
ncbi:MAG: HEAT repeat domain-containing protein [Elusimicrobia bacterium]|nr:HEAT repeat domain-containing protein [Candidatus Obscuribacterium magneticum]